MKKISLALFILMILLVGFTGCDNGTTGSDGNKVIPDFDGTFWYAYREDGKGLYCDLYFKHNSNRLVRQP